MSLGCIDERLGRSSEKIWLLPLEERAKRLMEIYKRKMGYEMDLNNPQTFNEKLQWYKLYYNHPDLSRCVDKVDAKEYVEEKIGKGHMAKLLRVFNSPDEIDFNGLPDKFVVKSNCQDGGNYVVMVEDKSSFDLEALKEEIAKYWFNPVNLLINGFFNAYHNVTPKVLVEEYLVGDLRNCKFFCFNGNIDCCYVSKNVIVNGVVDDSACELSYYDCDWKRIDVVYDNYHPYINAPKPVHFDEMIKIADVLSKDFPFVRVDFMETNEKLYVAELTFYPGGGMHTYSPESFNKYMGDLFPLIK